MKTSKFLQVFRVFLFSVFLAFSFISAWVAAPQTAQACCILCNGADCTAATAYIKFQHFISEEFIQRDITHQFNEYKDWFAEDFFHDQVLPAYMEMSTSLTALSMHQNVMTGSLLDAKNQMETQRLYQELQTQAHKDYQPSESFCWFGTNVKSLAAAEETARFTSVSLNARQMARHMRKKGVPGAEGPDDDKRVRWNLFKDTMCDPNDGNRLPGVDGTGLSSACPEGKPSARSNIDVDFTRLIEEPRSLDISFTDSEASEDEQNIMMLANNLYGHSVMEFPDSSAIGKGSDHVLLGMRAIAAKRNVAENSFNAIVGLKAYGPDSSDNAKTREFLGAIMKELGVPDDEIYEIIGTQPSYYAQLELLAKKIYQNPDFYAGLYDKPANVARKSVAMKGIEMMLDRAIFESQMRQEMVMSVLLSSSLRERFKDVNKEFQSGD